MKNRVKRILSLFFTASLLGSEFAPIAALAAEDRFAQTVSEDAEDDASGNVAKEVIAEEQRDAAVSSSVDAGSYDAMLTVTLDQSIENPYNLMLLCSTESDMEAFKDMEEFDATNIPDAMYDWTFWPYENSTDKEENNVVTFNLYRYDEEKNEGYLSPNTKYVWRLYESYYENGETTWWFVDGYDTFTTKPAKTKTNVKLESVEVVEGKSTYFHKDIKVKVSDPDKEINDTMQSAVIQVVDDASKGADAGAVSGYDGLLGLTYNESEGAYTGTVYKDEIGSDVRVAVRGGDGSTYVYSNSLELKDGGFVDYTENNMSLSSTVSESGIRVSAAFNPNYGDTARLFLYYREKGASEYTKIEKSRFDKEGKAEAEVSSLKADTKYEYYAEVYGDTSKYYDWSYSMFGSNLYNESMRGYTLIKTFGSADKPLLLNTADPNAVYVQKVTLSGNTLNSIKPGATRQFTAIIAPEAAAKTELKWESSDTSVATVDNTGKVTGISEGKAKIKASAEDESGQYAEVEITVADKAVKGISINEGEAIEITKGTSKQLTFTTDPKDATLKSVSWNSSAPGIATVDNNGRVTGVSMNGTTLSANGTTVSADSATVTVKFTDEQGNTVSADITVKVTEPKPAADPSEPGEPEAPEEPADTTVNVSSVTIEEGSSAALKISGGSGSVVYGKLQLNATVSPENATNKGISFNSSNPEVASVNEKTGLVTAVNEGVAVITATSVDGGKTASITVTVTIEYEFDIADKKSSLSADVVLQPDGAEDTPDKFMTLAANGKKATLNKKLTKKGHSFKGWYVTYTDNKGVTKAKKISAVNASVLKKYAVNGKLTLKAVFKANTYTIRYNKSAKLDGKTVKVSGKAATEKKAYMSNGAVATVTLAAADAFKPRENDIKFLGWTTKKNGSAVEYGAGATVSLADILPAKGKNITFYPVWGK
ncbi:MAG: Ig-like domain-containing protein [Lachnospiraceae bacterium]|nr:Ig-like domain-containing protein [Lachnospiraceae bacterium]